MLRFCGWIEGGTRVVLEQVVATRGELSYNVWASVSTVPSNDAITCTHTRLAKYGSLAILIVLTRENSSFAGRFITVNGTKGDVTLAAEIVDAATVERCRIARDGAIGQGECVDTVDAAALTVAIAASSSRIARDGAVDHSERAVETIVDAAASSSRIARDGAGDHSERAPVIVDAAADVAQDGAVGQGERAFIAQQGVGIGLAACEGQIGNVYGGTGAHIDLMRPGADGEETGT